MLSEPDRLRRKLRRLADRVRLETTVPPVLGKERGLQRVHGSPTPDAGFSGFDMPRVISISGANKDIGKSSLAAYLISHCSSCAAMKVTVHAERPPGEPVVEEVDAATGTDTARMLEAGASPVFWVRTTARDMEKDIEKTIPRLKAPVVVVEGNSVLDYLEPAYAVFIMGDTFDGFKPSAFDAIKKAHTVMVNGGSRLSGTDILALEREIRKMNPDAKTVVVSEMGRERALRVILSRVAGKVGGDLMSTEIDEELKQAVRSKSKEGRIACAVALKLAKDMNVPPAEVGKAANVQDIKIVKCSLGCF